MDVLVIRVTLADGSFVDCSTIVPLYLKLCGNLQLYYFGVFTKVYVVCHVLCHVLPNLTSDVVLGMDWLHAINPQIDWHAYSLYLDYGGRTIYILGL